MQFPSAQRPASAGQAGSAPLSGLRYFWSGRGLFRPGVVLLRSQRFRTKAWIISLSFLLPVIILAQGYFSSQREAREVALAELQGVADVRQLSKQLNELQAKAGDAARRQELLADYEKIADRSGLILDPEAPSYYAMDAALLVLPQLTDLATEQAAGKSGEATVARINDARKRLSAGLARLEAAVKTDADTLALVRGVQASLTGDKADKVEALWRAQAQMTDLLERLLHERSARISSESWRMGLLIVLSLLAGTYLFYSFALVTGGGISMIAQRIRVVAAGNLVGSSHAWGNDEFAYVARRVGEMRKCSKTRWSTSPQRPTRWPRSAKSCSPPTTCWRWVRPAAPRPCPSPASRWRTCERWCARWTRASRARPRSRCATRPWPCAAASS